TAHIDGVPIFECQYGTHNAKYAIRVTALMLDAVVGR
ncbi:MAG: flagellar motor switch protein FliM, partial [Betaproteobacteria bacterium]|nr:flagellar motor switch protein FliM [Betaproteobacteria bacterium]